MHSVQFVNITMLSLEEREQTKASCEESKALKNQ